MTHILPDCFAVWYNCVVGCSDSMYYSDELCEQGWADYYLDGINAQAARKARKTR